MRTLSGIALVGALALGAGARAQVPYAGTVPYGYGSSNGAPPAGVGYSPGYAFKDEPLMSINRSYLGYSNFVYYGPDPALGSYSTYAARRAPAYVPAPARVRWFGGWRGYR